MFADIRRVLAEHEALLVHFNTPMSQHPRGYPTDLHDALSNPQWALCCSTIVATDIGPGQDLLKAGGCGSVGIIFDLASSTTVKSVSGIDAGSTSRDGGAGLGSPPSPETCRDSILTRPDGYNEWLIEHPMVLGIFAFPNPHVFLKGRGELPTKLTEVAAEFPEHRVFTAWSGKFWEFDRAAGPVVRRYDEIVTAHG